MNTKFTKVNHNYRPLDQRPFPDYEPFGMKDMIDNYSMATRVLYRYSRPYPRPFVLVASRGCPFNCTFCRHGQDQQYRIRSIANIMQEIKETYEKYHYNVLIVLDELFAVSKGRLKEFSESILQGRHDFGWDFDWCFQTHANSKLNLQTLELARSAGCFNFSYGLESASPTVLKSMQKHIKPEQIKEAIQLVEQAGLNFSANLIFGDPAETEQTIYESMEFWFKYCQQQCVFLSYLQPYPGGKIFDDAVKTGIIQDKKDYYENIMGKRYNLTQMPNDTLSQCWNTTAWIETHWPWVKTTTGTCEEEVGYTDPIVKYHNAKMYQIKATCPYCGGETLDRHILGEIKGDSFIGRACVHCGKKIKIMLKGEP